MTTPTTLDSPAAVARAEERRSARIQDYASVVTPTNIAVSASGRIAYVRTEANPAADTTSTRSGWLPRNYSSPRDLPTPRRLGIPFDAVGLRSAGFLGHTTTVEGRRHRGSGNTADHHGAAPARRGGHRCFSPDGARIAFSAPVDRTAAGSSCLLVAKRLNYKVDGSGVRGQRSGALVRVRSGAGSLRQLTDGDWTLRIPRTVPTAPNWLSPRRWTATPI